MTGIHLMIGNVSLVGDTIMMIGGMVVMRFTTRKKKDPRGKGHSYLRQENTALQENY